MVETVLVAVDEAKPSTKALEFALEEYPDAEITALTVINPAEYAQATGIEARASYADIRQAHENRAEKILYKANQAAEERDMEITTERVFGKEPRAIIEYAEEGEFDHIVVGSHGRSGASRVLLGSVAEKVIRRAAVPVTVIR
jgi:nucleotide-binding universal stress UspA family protein